MTEDWEMTLYKGIKEILEMEEDYIDVRCTNPRCHKGFQRDHLGFCYQVCPECNGSGRMKMQKYELIKYLLKNDK